MCRPSHRLPPVAALLLALLAAAWAWPAGAASLIRDAEIEDMLDRVSRPLFQAAGLDPDEVDIYILRDDRLNAFVAGGQNLFVNTGLIIRSQTVDQLAGVIAHETGHIAGGHLSRFSSAREQAAVPALLGALLGAAAAVAGAPEVGTALMAGGATVAQGNLLQFTRTQEQAADEAAVTYLAAARMSPEGLVEFFKILDNQNLRITGNGNPFLRTHPLTRDRIAYLEGKVASSPYRDTPPDPALAAAHARSAAKLDGFLADPEDVLARRRGDGLPDRYARAIALYRDAQTDKALAAIADLIDGQPKDPYFRELQGQVLFENGRTRQAIEPYREAVRLRPTSALLRLGLARTLLEQTSRAQVDEAAALLQDVVRIEPENAGAWRFLGVAEGKRGNDGEAALALAEYAVLARKREDAMLYIAQAKQRIRPGDAGWYRLQDLERAADEIEDEPPPTSRRRR